MISKKAIDNRAKVEQIRAELGRGMITYNEALAKIGPIVQSINETAKQIAKEYNCRPRLVNARQMLR